MRCVLPTPPQLAESPELAALYTLENAIALTEYALLAVHPELEQADFFPETSPLTVEVCLADAILNHVAALEKAVGRYRLLLSQLDYRRRTAPLPADF